MSKQNKKITLNGLAGKVDKLASTVDRLSSTMEAGFKRTEGRIDGVEGNMKAGFKQVNEKMDAGFKRAEENRESLARMIANGFEDVTAKMATKEDVVRLEQGHENLQLRVDCLAPYFEVKHLERRVKRLEDRAGIRHSIQR